MLWAVTDLTDCCCLRENLVGGGVATGNPEDWISARAPGNKGGWNQELWSLLMNWLQNRLGGGGGTGRKQPGVTLSP